MSAPSSMATAAKAMLAASAVLAIGQIAAATSTAARVVGAHELRAEKHGRIVDSDTEAGIPGVRVIVNWRGSSTGLSGFYGGGGWCDLQRVVTTDADGNYTVPDVSKELDLSGMGTRDKKTGMGWMGVTHSADWVLSAFKPGYVQVDDLELVRRAAAGEWIGGMTLQVPPDVSPRAGRVEVRPTEMRKQEASPSEIWAYYSIINATSVCNDRNAKNIESSDVANIRQSISAAVRPMPCALPQDYSISPEAFGHFQALAHQGQFDPSFFERVKRLQGSDPSSRGIDPTERLATTAGTLCRALQEEDASK